MYFFGLDLGKSNDYTALCIARRTDFESDAGVIEINNVVRWPLGTPYVKVAEQVAEVIKSIPGAIVTKEDWPMEAEVPRKWREHNYYLVVDATGVGNAVVELLRKQQLRLTEVVITGGNSQPSVVDGQTRVPKVQLISPLRVALENRRLRVAAQIPHWREIERELMDFEEEISGTGAPPYGNRSASGHDDMVLAMALAVWEASRRKKFVYGF